MDIWMKLNVHLIRGCVCFWGLQGEDLVVSFYLGWGPHRDRCAPGGCWVKMLGIGLGEACGRPAV